MTTGTLAARRWLSAAAPAAAPPLILLFGWLGCDPRHLAKYAALYPQDEYQVLSVRPTMLQTASPRCADARALEFAARLAAASPSAPAPPVLVHLMSNAGFLAFGTLLRLAALPGRDAEPLREALGRVRGVVLDSAPSRATPAIWARGTVSAALGRPAAGVEAAHPHAVRAAEALARRYLARPAISRRLLEMRAAWARHAPLAPQLYLYSAADALIPASHVEAFMAQQARRGVVVTAYRWQDSAHCEHQRTHPQQYARLVCTFAQRCLGRGHVHRCSSWTVAALHRPPERGHVIPWHCARASALRRAAGRSRHHHRCGRTSPLLKASQKASPVAAPPRWPACATGPSPPPSAPPKSCHSHNAPSSAAGIGIRPYSSTVRVGKSSTSVSTTALTAALAPSAPRAGPRIQAGRPASPARRSLWWVQPTCAKLPATPPAR